MKTPALTFSAALIAAFLSAPGAVVAAPTAVEVQYNDLDLSTSAGMAQLNKRIADAAKQICSAGSATTGTILPSRAERQCYKETMQKLQDRVATVIEADRRG